MLAPALSSISAVLHYNAFGLCILARWAGSLAANIAIRIEFRKTLLCPLVPLTRCAHVPLLCLINVLLDADSNLCIVCLSANPGVELTSDSILCLGQTLVGRLPSPEVCFRV